MKNIVFIIAFLMAFACNKSDSSSSSNQNLDDAGAQATSTQTTKSKPKIDNPIMASEKEEKAIYKIADNEYDMVFEEYIEDPEWWRELRAVKSDGGIKFKISVKNTPRNCESFLYGLAKLKEGDMESRETVEGETLFVNEYNYEGETCGLTIAIDLDTESLVWIDEWDCPGGHDVGCPFGIGRVMPRIP